MDYDICRKCARFYECSYNVRHLCKVVPEKCSDIIAIRLVSDKLPNDLKKPFFRCFEICRDKLCDYEIEHIVSDYNNPIDNAKVNRIRKILKYTDYDLIVMKRDQIYDKIMFGELYDIAREDEAEMIDRILTDMLASATNKKGGK